MATSREDISCFRAAFECLRRANSLTCIFNPVPNFSEVDLSLIRKRNESWFHRFSVDASGPYQAKFSMIDCAKLSAFSYLGGNSDYILWGANLIAWLFIFDDFYGEAVKTKQKTELDSFYNSLLESTRQCKAVEDSPLHHGLVDLVRKGQVIDERWRERFANSLEKYFRGCLMEFNYRHEGKVLGLKDYRYLREHSIGVYPLLDLIEEQTIKIGSLVDFRENATFAEFDKMICLLCAWVNDLYSMPKELHAEDPINLVLVIQREDGCSLPEAFERALQVIYEDYERALAFQAEILRSTNNSFLAQRYMELALCWPTGNYYWSRETLRYHEKNLGKSRISMADYS